MRNEIVIDQEMLLDWFEALSYAFIDIDLCYKDEEAEEQVEETYIGLRKFLIAQGIDPIQKMRERGVIADDDSNATRHLRNKDD